jgi:hypothetical protein
MAVRGGKVLGVVLHANQGSEYTARAFRQARELHSVHGPAGFPG